MRPFEEVVAEHGPVVMRVCRALVGAVDAGDVWSETFVAALRAYPRLAPESNVRGWLVTIAHRKAIDEVRRLQRAPVPTGDVPEMGLVGEPQAVGEEMRAALDGLPAKQRGAVVYRYLADLPYAEVGRLLDSSEVAARRSASDGIAALRRTYTKGAAR